MTFDHAAPTVRLSVVLPAFNEAENIPRAITAAVDALERLNISFEIIVVDDGSHDDTGTLAQAAQREDPRVRVPRGPACRTVGMATS